MIFLDMVGTITDMEAEKEALIEIGREIGERFHLGQRPEEIWNHIERCRKPYMDERHIRYTPIRELIAECTGNLLKERGMHMSEEDEEWVKELYVGAHVKCSRLAPRAMEGIREMRRIAWHLGVISDADSDYLKAVLKALGVLGFFDSTTSSEDVGVGKPNPLIFREAMERARGGDVFIHIGDSERRDVKGAKEAGMLAVLVGKEEFAGRSDADHIARDLYDASVWIRNLIKEEKDG